MIKHVTLGLALAALFAGSALAQSTAPAPAPAPSAIELKPAQTPEDCLKMATDLATNATERQLAADRLDKIEDLLIKMETHCDARRFSEAHTVATDIKSLIETQ